ncbi:MAG: hypothetical protein AAGH83_09740 [Pseudomonadota bacterium]
MTNGNPDPKVVALEKCMEMYRHYSSIRFLMLPIYYTVMFAIFLVIDQSRTQSAAGTVSGVEFQMSLSKDLDGLAMKAAPIIGLLAALVFIFLEFVLNAYIRRYREAAKDLGKISGSQHFENILGTPPCGYWLVTWSIHLLYLCPAIVFATLLLCY